MLFQIGRPIDDLDALLGALRAIDPACRISAGPVPGQLEVQARMTTDQVIAALAAAGHEAVRVQEAQQIHVSGGSTCCGSCG